jgi:predicted HicB family RNase H-like nuclease
MGDGTQRLLGIAGYGANINLFHGNIVNTRGVITFQGATIEKSFGDSIDGYLR